MGRVSVLGLLMLLFVVAMRGMAEKSARPQTANHRTVVAHGGAISKQILQNFTSSAEKRRLCQILHGDRSYLPPNSSYMPPLLYTFPGSGNTWSRLLIEYASGIYSGSVYSDASLVRALPGEFTCNASVSVVKAHPDIHPVESLIGTFVPSEGDKCHIGNLTRFHRAILIVRNPYDTIWSEYQRRILDSHVGSIPRAQFNWTGWSETAASLAHQWRRMFLCDYAAIDQSFSAENRLLVRYEDLKDPTKRLPAVRRMVEFLRLPHMSTKQVEARLPCALALADNMDAHRRVNRSVSVTKDVAYVPDLACPMWAVFEEEAAHFGYGPWAGFNCTGYEAAVSLVGPPGSNTSLFSVQRVEELQHFLLTQSHAHPHTHHPHGGTHPHAGAARLRSNSSGHRPQSETTANLHRRLRRSWTPPEF